MVQKRIKIVNKSWRKEDVVFVLSKIINWDYSWLDIKQIEWKTNYYRCRIGKLRIIFFKKDWKIYIDKVWYRWDIYKK